MVTPTTRVAGTTTGSAPTRPTTRGMATPTATATVTPSAATAATADVLATPGEPYYHPADRVRVKQPLRTHSTNVLSFSSPLPPTTTELDAHFQSSWDIREQDEWNVSKSWTITCVPGHEPPENESAERSHPDRPRPCSPCKLDRQCGRRCRYLWKLRTIEVRLSRRFFFFFFFFRTPSFLIDPHRYGATTNKTGTNPFSKQQQQQNPETPFFSI